MINRRRFFGGLFGGGASAIAVSALQSIAPIAPIEQVTEVKKDRRYIFKLSGYVSQERRKHAGENLAAMGLNAIVVDAGVDSIYELPS